MRKLMSTGTEVLKVCKKNSSLMGLITNNAIIVSQSYKNIGVSSMYIFY